MAILEVHSLNKVYTTRFGGNKVQALNNVSFSVEEGEYIAIMGESGSGKTTLLNILASLDRPSSGSVLLNGKNLEDIREQEMASFRRDNLGFVFQDFNLLDTFSLEDNIYLPLVLAGVPYPEMKERLMPIAKKLGIAHLLSKYPYEVSGGQKQRLTIARALVTQPEILILDDSSSALDFATDAALRESLSELHGKTTIFIVSQRASSLRHADMIIVMDDGKIVGLGEHDELLSDCLVYREIYESQFGA